jgi:hypothetical protein
VTIRSAQAYRHDEQKPGRIRSIGSKRFGARTPFLWLTEMYPRLDGKTRRRDLCFVRVTR